MCVYVYVCKRQTHDWPFLHRREKHMKKNVGGLQEPNSCTSHIFKLKLPTLQHVNRDFLSQLHDP